MLAKRSAGVINCTSSHNPVEWHGIKFSLRDGSISPPRVTDFISERSTAYQRSELTHAPTKQDPGHPEMVDPREPYCQWLLDSGETDCRISLDHKRMRSYFAGKLVIVDEMHGTGRGYLRTILDIIGVPFQVIHAERDPRLGGLRAANPEEPHIQLLKETVAKTGKGVNKWA